MTRAGRIVIVTLGLMGAGAVFGGLAGTLAFVVGARLTGAPSAATEIRFLQLPALIGAVLGVVTLPIGAWLLMRRVPLGRALLGVVIGTTIGGVMGLVMPFGDRAESSIWAGFAGFVLAALWMWWRARLPAR